MPSFQTVCNTIHEIETLLAQPRHPAVNRVMKQARQALLEATDQTAPAPTFQEMPDSNGVYWLWSEDPHGFYWQIVAVELLRTNAEKENLFQWSPINRATWENCVPGAWVKITTPPSPQKG